MLNLSSLMVGTTQPKELAAFYKAVFEKAPDMQEGNWSGWQTAKGFFSIGEHSDIKGSSKEPGRIMFNLETEKVKEEFARIKSIKGATAVKDPYEMGGMWIATLADPDGNYFQLMTPWKG